MNFNRNYYKILGIEPTDDEKAIKNAYKRMAKRWHPDLNDNSIESRQMMKDINEAYEVLSDFRLRNEYNKVMFGSAKAKHREKSAYNYSGGFSYSPQSEEAREKVRKRYENKYKDANLYYKEFEKNIEEGRQNICTGSFFDKFHLLIADSIYLPSGLKFFMIPVFVILAIIWHGVDITSKIFLAVFHFFVADKR